MTSLAITTALGAAVYAAILCTAWYAISRRDRR